MPDLPIQVDDIRSDKSAIRSCASADAVAQAKEEPDQIQPPQRPGMWRVVIQSPNRNEPPIVFNRATLRSAISSMNRLSRMKVLIDWTPEMIAYLTANYRGIKASDIAQKLADMSGQEVSQNAVVGRANLLGLCRKRTRPIEGGF